MMTKTFRAPVALGLVAIFAASLVPASGADSPTTVYDFHVGSPGDPTWTMLKLNVTQPGVRPTANYISDNFHCPSFWGTYFMTGTPADADSYNGFGFNWNGGRTGYDAYWDEGVGTHQLMMQNDGTNECVWANYTVDYQELPLGTVYVLTLTAGVPFVGNAHLMVDGPGVQVVAVSSGKTSVYRNETQFGRGVGLVAFGPPVCGDAPDPSTPCQHNHVNPGGVASAAVEVGRQARINFRHHPFVFFDAIGAHNGTIVDPRGHVDYMSDGLAAGVMGGGVSILHSGPPPGTYDFNLQYSADAGPHVGANIAGVDMWFPEEQ